MLHNLLWGRRYFVMMDVHSVMCNTGHLRMILWIINYIETNSTFISPRDPPLTVGQPLVEQDLLPIETSRSHSVAQSAFGNSSGRVTSPTHRPLPNTQYSQETGIHAPGRIRTRNSNKPAATPISKLESLESIIFSRHYEYYYFRNLFSGWLYLTMKLIAFTHVTLLWLVMFHNLLWS